MEFTTTTFPTSPEQLNFLDVLNFYGYLNLYKKTIEEDWEEGIKNYCNALSFVTELTEDDYLENFPFCLKQDIPEERSEDVQQEVINELFNEYYIKQGDPLSLVRVEAHIHNILRSIPPIENDSLKEYSLKIDNRTFKLNIILWENYTGKYDLPSGPAIEVMRFSEFFEDGLDPSSSDYKIEHHKNRALGTLSYLLIEDGEKIPMNKGEREAHISQKMDWLKDKLNYFDVQQICFFLLKRYRHIEISQLLSLSGQESKLVYLPKNKKKYQHTKSSP